MTKEEGIGPANVVKGNATKIIARCRKILQKYFDGALSPSLRVGAYSVCDYSPHRTRSKDKCPKHCSGR